MRPTGLEDYGAVNECEGKREWLTSIVTSRAECPSKRLESLPKAPTP